MGFYRDEKRILTKWGELGQSGEKWDTWWGEMGHLGEKWDIGCLENNSEEVWLENVK